jgi:exodeoxyribonuclease VII large subunit
MIWRSFSARIIRKFKDATGEGLRDGIKVLVLVRAQFHPLYDFWLSIEDIDPSCTLGNLEAKLRKIRETLTQERIIQLNRSLRPPADFVRVAAMSPETSAGLGDFRQEADRLHAAGLCEFHFVRATFQGPAAPSSLLDAIETVLSAHRERPVDPLVIIRGGGAVTDLAWLNDLDLARRACRLPIPVLTGIGHERHSTILDEVAHRRFDTPSKTADHVTQLIRDNALAALADMGRIDHLVRHILARHADRLLAQRQRIEAQIRLGLAKAAAGVDRLGGAIRMGSAHQIESAGQLLCRAEERVRLGTDRIVEKAEVQLAGARESIKQTAGARGRAPDGGDRARRPSASAGCLEAHQVHPGRSRQRSGPRPSRCGPPDHAGHEPARRCHGADRSERRRGPAQRHHADQVLRGADRRVGAGGDAQAGRYDRAGS